MNFLSKKQFLIVYVILSILYTYFEVIKSSNYLLILAPIIIFSLIAYYWFSSTSKINYLYISTLVLQLIGSILLTLNGIDNFLVGFGMYFVVNLMFIIIITNKIGHIKLSDIYRIVLPFTFFFLVVISLLFYDVGLLKVLFLMFAIIISVFVSLSYFYYKTTKRKSAKWLFAGAIIYLFCDVISGLYYTIYPKVYFDALDTIAYLASIYVITYAMILDSNEIKVHKKKEAKMSTINH